MISHSSLQKRILLGRWKLIYKGSGSSAVFRYPPFCSAAFCSKPAEGSGKQRKCAEREAKMRTYAFSLSFKGSAEGSGGSAHRVAKMRKAARKRAKEARMGQRKCARAAKMRKGSGGQRGAARRKCRAARRQRRAAKMRHNCAFSLPRASFCSAANFVKN